MINKSVFRLAMFSATCSALLCCASTDGLELPADDLLQLGVWGGDNAGLIVSDTAAHLHVGCTYGDVSGRIPLNGDGAFDLIGSYMLHAYPVAYGPTVPARFAGRVKGSTVTITVTVNDTVAHQTVIKGPVAVSLGSEIKLGSCPICRRPIITMRQARHR